MKVIDLTKESFVENLRLHSLALDAGIKHCIADKVKAGHIIGRAHRDIVTPGDNACKLLADARLAVHDKNAARRRLESVKPAKQAGLIGVAADALQGGYFSLDFNRFTEQLDAFCAFQQGTAKRPDSLIANKYDRGIPPPKVML